MNRRVLLAGLGIAVIGGAAGVTAVAADSSPSGSDAPTTTVATNEQSTAEVRRTDLVETEDLDGTLGYGEPNELPIGRQGVVTALPAAGTIVERGGSVAEVNGAPVPLLYGTRPLWRKLTDSPVGADGLPTGDELTGPDVRILEENLQALGFIDADSDAKVDETFTGSTAIAVKKWQKSLGLAETGVVDPADVVVREGPVRISAHVAEVGAPSGGPVVKVTGTERRITIALAATRRDLLAVGDPVEVTMPDGAAVAAKVESVGSTVTPGDPQMGTSDTIEIVVRLDDPAVAGTYDSAPVDVTVTSSKVTDVLAVPVGALLALTEGGYAVELVQGDGTSLVGVDVGAFADGLVQVEGEVDEGDLVVVPS